MKDRLIIRNATPYDAREISLLIRKTLTETNAKDYPASVLKQIIGNFSEKEIIDRMKKRRTFVITNQEIIIGTASLENNYIKTVFILPSEQGKNAGTLLIKHLENIARKDDFDCLIVQSSITAEGFYHKLGYKFVHSEDNGEEKIIIMKKNI